MYDRRRNESGAVLILALIFVIVTGLVGVALLSLADTNLLSTSGLQLKRGNQYAADGAVDAAVQEVRYSGAAFPVPASCFPIQSGGGPTVFTMNGASLYVYCVNSGSTPPNESRSIVFTACQVATVSCPLKDTELTAQVNFNDYNNFHAFAPGTAVWVISWANTT